MDVNGMLLFFFCLAVVTFAFSLTFGIVAVGQIRRCCPEVKAWHFIWPVLGAVVLTSSLLVYLKTLGMPLAVACLNGMPLKRAAPYLAAVTLCPMAWLFLLVVAGRVVTSEEFGLIRGESLKKICAAVVLQGLMSAPFFLLSLLWRNLFSVNWFVSAVILAIVAGRALNCLKRAVGSFRRVWLAVVAVAVFSEASLCSSFVQRPMPLAAFSSVERVPLFVGVALGTSLTTLLWVLLGWLFSIPALRLIWSRPFACLSPRRSLQGFCAGALGMVSSSLILVFVAAAIAGIARILLW